MLTINSKLILKTKNIFPTALLSPNRSKLKKSTDKYVIHTVIMKILLNRMNKNNLISITYRQLQFY